MSDFSRWVRQAMIEAGADREAATKFERRVRKEWGGKRVYIAKNAPPVVPDRRQCDATDAGGTSGTYALACGAVSALHAPAGCRQERQIGL